MSAINQRFDLEARFESIDQAERSITKLAVATGRQNSSMGRLVAWSKKVTTSVAQSAKVAVEQQRAYNRVDMATRNLISSLRNYEKSLNTATNNADIDASVERLEKQMGKLGLAFTRDIDSADRFFLLASNSLEELAQKGEIAANSMARIEFDEQKTAARAERTQKALQKLGSGAKSVASFAKKAVSGLLGFGKATNPVDNLSNRLTRTVVTLFSVSRVLGYITDAMERAPDKIANSFMGLGSTIKDSFARIMVSAMGGMQNGVEKLSKAMNSKAGQTLFRGLERAAQLAGNAIGKLLEAGAGLIEFLGGHAQEVFTVAAIAAGFFAAQMLISAAASLAAAWPLILIVGLAAALVAGLTAAGVTSEEIFEKIGQGAGWLYALVYNIVADVYNLFVSFAEFFANFMNDPVSAVAHLVIDLADTVLGFVQTIADAIGALFGKDWGEGIQVARNRLQNWADEAYGEKEITLKRMEHIDFSSTMEDWGNKAREISSSFGEDSLSQQLAPELKSVKSDTSAIKKAVTMSQEDLKSLVDMAERRFVNQINLTTQRPVINVNGSNTGRTAEDRLALANAIKEVLVEETASGSTVATAMP